METFFKGGPLGKVGKVWETPISGGPTLKAGEWVRKPPSKESPPGKLEGRTALPEATLKSWKVEPFRAHLKSGKLRNLFRAFPESWEGSGTILRSGKVRTLSRATLKVGSRNHQRPPRSGSRTIRAIRSGGRTIRAIRSRSLELSESPEVEVELSELELGIGWNHLKAELELR